MQKLPQLTELKLFNQHNTSMQIEILQRNQAAAPVGSIFTSVITPEKKFSETTSSSSLPGAAHNLISFIYSNVSNMER